VKKNGIKSSVKLGLATLGVGSALVVGALNAEKVYNKFQPRVSVELADNEENIKEEKVNYSAEFTEYDYKTGNYLVNVDKMFNSFLINDNILNKNDLAVNKAKAVIYNNLGDKVYLSSVGSDSVVLTDLNGKEIQVYSMDDKKYFDLVYANDNNIIEVTGNYEYYHYGNETLYNVYNYFDKYCEDNLEGKDVGGMSLIYRRDNDLLLSFHLSKHRLTIDTNSGMVNFNITTEEKEMLWNEFIKYKESNDKKSFLINNKEFLNSLFEEILIENEELYNSVIDSYNSLINENNKILTRNK